MGASRLVSIILLLQARGPMTAEQLAAELEVSVCTIYRDADSLDHPLLCPDQRGSARRCCASLPLTVTSDSDVEPCRVVSV
jgi:DeoR/GlpR family transcriptional regulator of sugar metabolism